MLHCIIGNCSNDRKVAALAKRSFLLEKRGKQKLESADVC